jgi:hypothetical protein
MTGLPSMTGTESTSDFRLCGDESIHRLNTRFAVPQSYMLLAGDQWR